jgi:hypothetical protein
VELERATWSPIVKRFHLYSFWDYCRARIRYLYNSIHWQCSIEQDSTWWGREIGPLLSTSLPGGLSMSGASLRPLGSRRLRTLYGFYISFSYGLWLK